MNWRFTLPFAIVAVVVLAVAGVAMMNMGNQDNTPAVQPLAVHKAPAPVAPAKTTTAAVVSTGDPIQDIVGTVTAEGAGDSAIMASAAADSAVVNNDSADLSALSTSYDATTF